MYTQEALAPVFSENIYIVIDPAAGGPQSGATPPTRLFLFVLRLFAFHLSMF
jgi:N-acetylmuramoyl-L-alanine amidase